MSIEYTRQELQLFADYYADQYLIPRGIFSGLINAESAWNPKAKAKPTKDNPNASAEGLTQIIKSTQKELGITDIKDPEQQLNGGALYLSKMYSKFNNWRDALAAYNQGPGGDLEKGYAYADKIIKSAGGESPQSSVVKKPLVIIDPTNNTSVTVKDLAKDSLNNVNDKISSLDKVLSFEFLGNAATIIIGTLIIGGALLIVALENKGTIEKVLNA